MFKSNQGFYCPVKMDKVSLENLWNFMQNEMEQTIYFLSKYHRLQSCIYNTYTVLFQFIYGGYKYCVIHAIDDSIKSAYMYFVMFQMLHLLCNTNPF